MKHTIVSEGLEDLTVTVKRIGRRVLVTSERPGVAKSLERSIIRLLEVDPPAPSRTRVVGFGVNDQEGD